MLTALRHPRLGPDELVRARQIVLNAARRRDRPFWIVPSWARRLSARFWSEEWAGQLVGLAVGHGDDSDAARRLVAGHPVELHESQRRALAGSVIQVVDTGGDESWFEGLAPLVDSPELRLQLQDRHDHGNADVRRRARWALNAIHRAAERRTDPSRRSSETP